MGEVGDEVIGGDRLGRRGQRMVHIAHGFVFARLAFGEQIGIARWPVES
jgi:hypothetical protein